MRATLGDPHSVRRATQLGNGHTVFRDDPYGIADAYVGTGKTIRLIVATSIVSISPQPLLASRFTTHSIAALRFKERRKWPKADFQTSFFPLPCLRRPEKFATGVWASLQSGYALLARRPDTRILSTNPPELPLKDSETVFKQTRPPLCSRRQLAQDFGLASGNPKDVIQAISIQLSGESHFMRGRLDPDDLRFCHRGRAGGCG